MLQHFSEQEPEPEKRRLRWRPKTPCSSSDVGRCGTGGWPTVRPGRVRGPGLLRLQGGRDQPLHHHHLHTRHHRPRLSHRRWDSLAQLGLSFLDVVGGDCYCCGLQCCGSKYIEFDSGFKILAQFGSGSGDIFIQFSHWIVILCLKSYTFCLYFILYFHVWIRIQNLKAPEYGSNPDPAIHNTGCLLMLNWLCS